MKSALLALCLGGALFLTGCGLVRPPANTFLITGNEYFKKGDYDAAEKQYREAVLSDSKSATALNNLGVILYVQGEI